MSIKYREVAEQLKAGLADCLTQGQLRLPTEKALCETFQVSRQTIRQALMLLEKDGLIVKKQGSGSYITGLLPDAAQNKIAILLSSDTEYIFPALLNDFETLLAKEGYFVTIYISHNRVDCERRILQSLAEAPPRALLAEPVRSAMPTPNFDWYEKLSGSGTHLLFFHGYYNNLPPSLYVKDDNYSGGLLLGQYLLEQKHTRIAGIFQLDSLQGQERYLGFIRSLMDADCYVNDDSISWFTTDELTLLEQKQDTRFLVDFINQKLGSCSAVICHNDEIAYWLIKELTYMKIQVPEDISVVSFDNSYLCELSTPRLTSLAHEPHAMASAVVSLLLKKMQGQNVSSLELPWKLVKRNSNISGLE